MAAIVGRNLVLIVLWCAGWRLTERRAVSHAPSNIRKRPALAGIRGFTLIEVVLVIALVGLLTLLLLPSVGSVRDKARRLSVLSSMRQHSAIFASYTSDWQDYYPAYARPDATLHVIRSQAQTLVYPRYFDVVSGWNVALADMYYDGRSEGIDFQRQREMTPITNYWYASCFLARPEFWNPATRTGPEQWGAVKSSQVQWPASKVLLFDYWRWMGDPPQADRAVADTDVSLVDGSARSAKSRDFLPAYVGGDGGWPGSVMGFGIPGLHTIDGVRGRDFK